MDLRAVVIRVLRENSSRCCDDEDDVAALVDALCAALEEASPDTERAPGAG